MGTFLTLGYNSYCTWCYNYLLIVLTWPTWLHAWFSKLVAWCLESCAHQLSLWLRFDLSCHIYVTGWGRGREGAREVGGGRQYHGQTCSLLRLFSSCNSKWLHVELSRAHTPLAAASLPTCIIIHVTLDYCLHEQKARALAVDRYSQWKCSIW